MTAQPQKIQTQAETSLMQQFAFLGLEPSRQAAADRLNESGLPHRRVEEWKYTDLRALLKDVPQLASGKSVASTSAGQPLVPADFVLAVVDGVPQEISNAGATASDAAKEAVSIEIGLGDTKGFHEKPNANVDLNIALASSGYVIRVKKSTVTPIIFIDHIVSKADAITAASRHSILVENGAQAILVERFSGTDDTAYVASAGLSVIVEDGAKLTQARVVAEGAQSSHLATIGARIGSEAIYEPFVMTIGSHLVRTDVQITFDGEQSHLGIRGATLVKGKQHTDMTLDVDHASPNCTSIEQFKSVIADEAKAVFQGKIMVKQIAQKTDAKMMSQGLLLSENGEFLNKPELEIFADDVICGHGATCGDIDEDMLFYLLSRGIPRPVAETMMVQAFVAEAIEDTEQPEIIEALEAILADWLSRR
ncbi:Fe-S cluster assembly protein SufD [Pararhizobium sp. IMCC21322]|uniref:Fe-S cluster assembly protein SufD n=1 Tax=Pararhizobium sp. IMCC21322 TaxID=3067903 RepID=UPI0027425D71|nr:Fe-S cluster assembly protein SufD [Pararhizobium sp. IMCC21322]